MNTVLWILQIALAVHTGIGAVWKLSNPAPTVPSMKAIPQGVWNAMSVVELLAGIGLIIPVFIKPTAFLIPIAAVYIAAEMLLFTVVHTASGDKNYSPVIYWLIVTAVCAFIAYGRFVVMPI